MISCVQRAVEGDEPRGTMPPTPRGTHAAQARGAFNKRPS